MMGNNRIIPALFLLCLVNLSYSQTGQKPMQSLSYPQFMRLVMENHPISRQARLLSAEGQATLRMARGGLDPSFGTSVDAKKFSEKDYWRHLTADFKVPTITGLEFKGGFEQNSGSFLDNERFTPPDGIFLAGLSIPLLEGLITDQRRTALKQAKIFSQQTAQEQIAALNDVYLTATSEFWKWQQTYEVRMLAAQGLMLAEDRFQFVRSSALFGEMSYLDTIEASVEVGKRRNWYLMAELLYRNSTLMLSTFLWGPDDAQFYLSPESVPDTTGIGFAPISADSLSRLANYAAMYHPDLKIGGFKVDQLKLDLRLKKQSMLPRADLDAMGIFNRPLNDNELNDGYVRQNYKWGLNFYTPLLLRKERGAVQLADIKVRNAGYDLQNKQRLVINKVYQAYNDLILMETMLRVQIDLVEQTQKLRDGEQKLFENGESSLFVLNRRERELIEEQVRLARERANYAILKIKLQYAAGVPLN